MKILLVDDHSLFRQGLEMLVKQLPGVSEILHADSGNQAVQQHSAHGDLALVVLDYNLGDGVGTDVLLRLKARDPALPVLLLSADAGARPVSQALAAGASGYALKNMDSAEILRAIKTVLDGGRYIPPDLQTASENSDQPALHALADVARNIMKSGDLSLRAEHGDQPCEVISAFNSLLEEIHQERDRLSSLAFRDELTGLYNRRYFMEALEQAMRLARRDKNPFALVYMDLDKFKQVNDTLGHDAGDALLVEIASRLRATLREMDIAARLGGDEFILVINAISNEQNLRESLARLLSAIRQPFAFNGQPIQPGASLGATLCQCGEDAATIMKRADAALYLVKQQGRNNFRIE